MDPNANLREQLQLASALEDAIAYSSRVDLPDDIRKIIDDTARLAELALSLDLWIAKGGALPSLWREQ